MKRFVIAGLVLGVVVGCGQKPKPVAPPPPAPVIVSKPKFDVEIAYAKDGTKVALLTDLEKGCQYIAYRDSVSGASSPVMALRLEQFGPGYRPTCNQKKPKGLVE